MTNYDYIIEHNNPETLKSLCNKLDTTYAQLETEHNLLSNAIKYNKFLLVKELLSKVPTSVLPREKLIKEVLPYNYTGSTSLKLIKLLRQHYQLTASDFKYATSTLLQRSNKERLEICRYLVEEVWLRSDHITDEFSIYTDSKYTIINSMLYNRSSMPDEEFDRYFLENFPLNLNEKIDASLLKRMLVFHDHLREIALDCLAHKNIN